MKYILIILTTFTCLHSSGQSLNNNQIDNIKKFLTDFKTAVNKKDSIQLDSMVIPYIANEKNIKKEIIKHALLNNEQKMRDFSYSNKAIDLIINTLTDKFFLLPDEPRYELINNELKQKKLPIGKNDQIAVLDFKECHIALVLKPNEKVKLFFWEGMNNLL